MLTLKSEILDGRINYEHCFNFYTDREKLQVEKSIEKELDACIFFYIIINYIDLHKLFI